jgi:hypothetical protein
VAGSTGSTRRRSGANGIIAALIVLAVVCCCGYIGIRALNLIPNQSPSTQNPSGGQNPNGGQGANDQQSSTGQQRLINQAAASDRGVTMTVKALQVSTDQTFVTFTMDNPSLGAYGITCTLNDAAGNQQVSQNASSLAIPGYSSKTQTAAFNVALGANVTSIGFTCSGYNLQLSVQLKLRPGAAN